MITFPIARAGAATLEIQGKMANRHGLIAGATGTGKTVTLRRMAEAFSNQGVPVFLADVKGDLSGIVNAGADSGKVGERIAEFGLGAAWLQSFPVRFWDVFGEAGIPLRVTISEMGPMLLSRLMNLNDTQEGLLNLVFRVADDNGWHLIDLKDLRGLLKHVADHAAANPMRKTGRIRHSIVIVANRVNARAVAIARTLEAIKRPQVFFAN